jgi:hypothetical protein
LFGIGVPPSATFRFEGWIKGSDGRVFLNRNAISAVRRVGIAWVWDVKKVGMLFAEQILEKGIDMHSPHPSFQSDGILLYLLCRLTFGKIRWLDSKILSELTPSFDLLRVKFDDEFPQGERLKLFVVTSRRRVELGPKRARVRVERELRIAVQDEGYVSICNVVRVNVFGGQ